jgi:hypothetical protein
MHNYLNKSILVLGAIITSLCTLSFVNEFHISNLKFKKISIISDIQLKVPPHTIKLSKKIDSLKIEEQTKEELFNNGIEDFSENRQALKSFFQAINKSRNHPVRIAFFGDSFIEGDILCANFRDTLQRVYGGRGVGFVPITSEVSRFRTTIQHSYANWKTYSIVGEKNTSVKLGTAGYCFVPQEENELEYKPAAKGKTFSLHGVKLYLKNSIHKHIEYIINDTLSVEQALEPSPELQELAFAHDNIQSIKFKFPATDSLQAYGACFEEPYGVYVDNFAMRGNSGVGLYQIDASEHKQFNHYREYKLIILQYGLNVVNETDTAGYSWYVERMKTVIDRLKACYPEASFLLLSVSDRSHNVNGTFETIPAIPVMVEAQREIAKKTKIAFWDIYHAMGGRNSMVAFVNAKPTMAAKDYTHLTYWGGKKIANLLAKDLLKEKIKYE